MGLILVAGMAAGVFAGLLASGLAAIPWVVVSIRLSASRRNVWWVGCGVALCVSVLLAAVVVLFPADMGPGGSNLDIAMRVLFLKSLGTFASPGAGFLAATLAVLLAPTRE